MGLLGNLLSPIGDIFNGVFGSSASQAQSYEHQVLLNQQQQAYNLQNMQKQFGYNQQLAGMQFRQNANLMELQNRYNVEMFNRENEYNSPAAQRARMQAAGLNPNFENGQSMVAASGQGTGLGSASPESVGLPSASAGSSNVGASHDILGLIHGVQEVANMRETIHQKKAQTKLIEAQTRNLNAGAGKTEAETPGAAALQESQTAANNASAYKLTEEANQVEPLANAKIEALAAQAGVDKQKAAEIAALITPKVNETIAHAQMLMSQKFYNEKSIELGTRKLQLEKRQLNVSAFLANHQAKMYDSQAAYYKGVVQPLRDMYSSISKLNLSQASWYDVESKLKGLDYDAHNFIIQNYPQEYWSGVYKKYKAELSDIISKANSSYQEYQQNKSRSNLLKFKDHVKKVEWLTDELGKGGDIFLKPWHTFNNAAQSAIQDIR